MIFYLSLCLENWDTIKGWNTSLKNDEPQWITCLSYPSKRPDMMLSFKAFVISMIKELLIIFYCHSYTEMLRKYWQDIFLICKKVNM